MDLLQPNLQADILEIIAVMERNEHMENRLMMPGQTRVFVSILGVMVVALAALTLMACLPPADQIPSFVIGVIVLIAVVTGIGLLGWHLLLRPLPANLQVIDQPLLTASARRIIALVLTLGTVSIALAGVWDETWHTKYGIPFGQDFFWRPHLMLYFGLSTLAVIGGWSWWTIMTRGKGTLQQRFRANPLLGVTFLGGLYTIYAVGADPIWHKFYGADLAPWSLPHLLILGLIFLMSTLALAYHKSFMAAREWAARLNFNWRDILLVVVLAGALLDFTLIFTIQWYSASAGSAKQLGQVMGYPDWLLAVFITFLATLFGTTALHATRRVGSATLVGILAVVMRLILDAGLSSVREGTRPMWLLLPILLALDVWYFVSIRRTGKPPVFWQTGILAAVVFGITGVPLIMALFSFLPVTLTSLPGMVIASLITAVGAVWLGQIVGGMSGYGQAETASTETSQGMLSGRWVNVVLYVAFIAFVIIFAATATPPA
jgi:hypothetical protein